MTDDPFNLNRFVEAQQGVFEQACAELRRGEKRGHWMWFIFPQIRGLGASAMSRKFAISSLDEARAYLAHPVLGSRLKECAQIVDAIPASSARDVFGEPDDMKLRSSMTLFALATSQDEIFMKVLEKYFDGLPDELTVEQLPSTPTPP